MRRSAAPFVVAGLALALVLAFVVSRSASSDPDGLERVAIDEGFAETAGDHALADGPLADYTTEGVDDPGTSTGVAGVVGVIVVFALAGSGAWLATRRRVDAAP